MIATVLTMLRLACDLIGILFHPGSLICHHALVNWFNEAQQRVTTSKYVYKECYLESQLALPSDPHSRNARVTTMSRFRTHRVARGHP